jgi:hypothetical protein
MTLIRLPIRRPRAGRYAQARYEELRRTWRKRVLGRIRLVVWPLIAVSFLGAALPEPWGWFAGFLGGCCYIIWLVARDAVPHHIGRWLDGAEGERRTEKQLRPLEFRGWHVAHDLQGRFGNVDHLVVGPAGVFLLDSKTWSGVVTVESGAATVTPRDNPDASWTATGLGRKMRGASVRNKEALQRLTGVRTWIQPVVVVWAPFPARHVVSDGIAYVAGDALRSWLLDQPAKLDDERTARVARVIAH